MSRFDEIIDQATRRLRVDRELQLTVQRELRDHLEDAAAEFGDAGNPDAEAAALHRFGSADDLAEQLWQANRRRLSRRAVAKWTIRVVVFPAMVLAVLAVPVRQVMSRVDVQAISERVSQRLEAEPGQQASSVITRLGSKAKITRDELEQAERALSAALDAEPESGIWPLILADLRLRAAGTTHEGPRFTFVVDDAKTAQDAVNSLRRAANASDFRNHTAAAAAEVYDELDTPTVASYVLAQSAVASEVIDRSLNLLSGRRRTVQGFAAYARTLADDGRFDEARAILKDLETVSLKSIRDAGMLSSLLVGVSMHAKGLEVQEEIESMAGEQARLDDLSRRRAEVQQLKQDAGEHFAAAALSSDKWSGMATLAVSMTRAATPRSTQAARDGDQALKGQAITTLVLVQLASLAFIFVVAGFGRSWWRRAEGLPVVLLPHPLQMAVFAAAAVLAATFICGWMLHLSLPNALLCSFAVSLGVVAAAFASVRRRWRTISALTPPRGTLERSVLPLIGIAALVLALTALPWLMLQETRAVRQLQQIGTLSLVDEVQRTPYRELQAWAAQQLQERSATQRFE